jgi:hypothetical protein
VVLNVPPMPPLQPKTLTLILAPVYLVWNVNTPSQPAPGGFCR